MGQSELRRFPKDTPIRELGASICDDKICLPVGKLGKTDFIVAAYERKDGAFELFSGTRRSINDLLAQGKRKVCFKLPKGCDRSRFQILGERRSQVVWMSGSIVGKCQVIRGQCADLMLPSSIPPSKTDCEGSCCIWRFGFCDRRQPAWRRSCILLFDLCLLVLHLFIAYQLCYLFTCCCCKPCQPVPESKIKIREAEIAQTISSTVGESYSSFVTQNRPPQPKGFNGLMTVEIDV